MKVSLKTILALTLCLATALFFGAFASAAELGSDDAGASDVAEDAGTSDAADDAEASDVADDAEASDVAEDEDASDETEVQVSEVRFELKTSEDDGSHYGVIDGYEGDIPEDGILTIPETYQNEAFGAIALTEIKYDAFAYDAFDESTEKFLDIKEIVIPASIKEIGDNAFVGLTSVEKVTIMGDTVIGKNVFADCIALESVQFLGKQVTVGEGAFSGCYTLKSVLDASEVYASGTDFILGINAFSDTQWYDDYGVDFVTLGSTLVGYRGTDSVVTIPLNIKRIGDGAFMYNYYVKKVVISKNVWYIGEKAFYNAGSLADVEFSRYGEITYVGADAFYGTRYFNDYEGDFFTVGTILIKYLGDDIYVSIPNTVTVISPDAFLGCYKSSRSGQPSYTISAIKVPASVVDFGKNCFALNAYEDGSIYCPMLYAFRDTEAAKFIAENGLETFTLSIPGDANGDNEITAEDARLVLRIAVKLDIDADPAVKFVSDVDGDGYVKAEDARLILRLVVALENYSAKDLMYKPGTVFEVLQAYTKALKNVVRYNAGYTKTISKVLTSYDLDSNTRGYLSSNIGCNFDKADLGVETKTYLADSTKAIDAMGLCTLLSTDSIKSATCILNDGKYTISILFKDIEDIDGTTELTKVMPLTSRTYYDKILSNQYWFKWKYNSFTYDLIYKAKVVAVMDADTMKLESVEQTCVYSFENIDGTIYAIPVTEDCDSDKDAGSAIRTDTIKYENFIF